MWARRPKVLWCPRLRAGGQVWMPRVREPGSEETPGLSLHHPLSPSPAENRRKEQLGYLGEGWV